MKRTIVIMRHAKAAPAAPGMADYDRPLTESGESSARAQAMMLAGINVWPDVILCSTAIRARQTYDAMRAVWEGEMEPFADHRTDLYRCGPEEIIKMLRAHDPGYSTLMVIGHNPVIGQLALMLLREEEARKNAAIADTFPPASCAVLELDLRSWSEASPKKAALSGFYPPGTEG